MDAPEDPRPRNAIARTRAFARGELGVVGEIRRRFAAGGAARDVRTPAAEAAARAAGQAAAIPHMGAHALGAAAYAALAAGSAAPGPTGGCQPGDPLAACPYDRHGKSRPATASARR